jgi:hypothetical protein
MVHSGQKQPEGDNLGKLDDVGQLFAGPIDYISLAFREAALDWREQVQDTRGL